MTLPAWAAELVALYESGAANQFLLTGNVHDRFLLPNGTAPGMGDLKEFLLKALLTRFDVVLEYDLGRGLTVAKGPELFADWPTRRESSSPLPRQPLAAVDMITHYFRYVANLASVKPPSLHVAVVVHDVQLLAPVLQGGAGYEVGALASQVRGWSTDSLFTDHSLASFLLADNLNDLNPLLANNPRAARIEIPLPSSDVLSQGLKALREKHPAAVPAAEGETAAALVGTTLRAVESLVKTKQHQKQALADKDLAALKKDMVEKDCQGLIDFLEPRRTLDDLHGLEGVKAWLRQDLALWKKNDIQALPKGYLFCGPVGTGKSYLVECLAGEAGVPVVKFKNFRDKWVGSTEGNLERIFRLLSALGRCYVFIDEADQTLGKRDSGSGDSGLSGRIYSMMAEEMGRSDSRGRLIWILASSRPDLIEVDLKRPGRVDVKVPLFPASTPAETYHLIRMLFKRRGLALPEGAPPKGLRLPDLLTPGAAETLAVKVYRLVRTEGGEPLEVLRRSLEDYQDPVPADIMASQIRLALAEASDLSFVPKAILDRFKDK